MKPLLVSISFFAFLFPIFSKADPLEVGATAPDLEVVNQDGKTQKLSDYYAKGITLVYFYPKAGTPGCTAQACSLRDSTADLGALGLVVVGVSSDSVEAQKKFQQKHGLPFDLIADTEGKVADAFGVPRTMGLPSRQSFLVRDGRIVWRSLKSQTHDYAKEVQNALAQLP